MRLHTQWFGRFNFLKIDPFLIRSFITIEFNIDIDIPSANFKVFESEIRLRIFGECAEILKSARAYKASV